MSDKVRLWRGEDGDWSESACGCGSPAHAHTEDGETLTPYIARPAADDEALLRALLKSSLDAGAWKARAEKAEAALAEAVKAERARIAKHLRHLGLAGPATQVERCPSCYDLGVVGAGDEPCTAVACDAHAAKVREDAARQGGTDGR